MTNDLENLRQKSILHLENVYKEYNDKLVLDNIDLAVTKGELCSLVGPSGCGKSTLFRLIVGEELPTSGLILVEGSHAGFPDISRGIVYQKYPLYPHLSVLDNVLLGRRLSNNAMQRHRQKKEFEEEAMHYLEEIKLAKDKDKFPHELSGGMQQRVAIAQALIMKPKILMMDEPFSGLDSGVREHLQVFLLELWEKSKLTIFFVTHNLIEAVYLGTRILVLSQHYTDDRGPDAKRGAKIVGDYQLERKAAATAVKITPEFNRLVQQISHEGFDPEHLQHVKNFNLKHLDSFQTLTKEEDNSLLR